ncbi:MAG: tetratricopeptide repeat protein, partial [Spirochaetota bacterium]
MSDGTLRDKVPPHNAEAEVATLGAILLDPDTLDWKLGLARAFFKQERYAEAVALTRQLIGTNPDRTDLWLLQANAYIGLGQALDAAEIYEIVDNLGGSTA